MKPASLINSNLATGPTVALVGDKYTILAAGDQTAGAYALIESVVPPQGGPPPHYHTREEESFYILQGTMTFFVEGKPVRAPQGSFVQMPRGTVHCFKNETAEHVRMLVMTFPAGFDQFMLEIGTPLNSPTDSPPPPNPAEIERLLAIAPKYGIHILPPK